MEKVKDFISLFLKILILIGGLLYSLFITYTFIKNYFNNIETFAKYLSLIFVFIIWIGYSLLLHYFVIKLIVKQIKEINGKVK